MKSSLEEYVKEFYIVKNEADKYKKLADEDNKEIKKLMQNNNLTEFKTTNGLLAKITIQNRESFNEDKLIEKLKELNVKTPIKTVEVIDYDALEDAIYNNVLDATKIIDCKQNKQVVTLKVSEQKGE